MICALLTSTLTHALSVGRSVRQSVISKGKIWTLSSETRKREMNSGVGWLSSLTQRERYNRPNRFAATDGCRSDDVSDISRDVRTLSAYPATSALKYWRIACLNPMKGRESKAGGESTRRRSPRPLTLDVVDATPPSNLTAAEPASDSRQEKCRKRETRIA